MPKNGNVLAMVAIILVLIIGLIQVDKHSEIDELRQELHQAQRDIELLRRDLSEAQIKLREVEQTILVMGATIEALGDLLEAVFGDGSDWEVLQMEATFYAPLDPGAVEGWCYSGNPAITATGTTPALGTVAVNPDVIPYGSILWVEGYGLGIAADTGGMIRARTDLLDLCVDTQAEALERGREQVRVIRLD